MVCLCSSLFFLGLYQFNNKYSQNTIQAANGILALSEEELQKSPVRFLVSGWAFYPDALLTPEEIRDESHYMRYLSIGEHTNFFQPCKPFSLWLRDLSDDILSTGTEGNICAGNPGSVFCLQPLSGSRPDPANGGTGTGDTIGSKPHGHFSWRKTGHTHHSGQQL